MFLMKEWTMTSKNRAAATGLLAMRRLHSTEDLNSGLNFSPVSAKYRHMGCLLSAGESVINQDGAPRKEIKDQISFRIYFLLVMDPLTWPPTWSRSSKTEKQAFSCSVLGRTYLPSVNCFINPDRTSLSRDINLCEI